MKSLLLAYLVLCVNVFAAFPSEIHLTNGRTLKNASPLRWDRDYVVVKHQGGADPVRFEHMIATDRQAVEAERPAPAKLTATPAAPGLVKISGEAFLASGVAAGERVKFAGMTITAYPLEKALAAVNRLSFSEEVEWPEPIASVQTDSEGRFTITLPPGVPFMLNAKARHYATKSKNTTDWEWRIQSTEISAPTALMLTQANATKRDNIVEIRVR